MSSINPVTSSLTAQYASSTNQINQNPPPPPTKKPNPLEDTVQLSQTAQAAGDTDHDGDSH